MMQSLPYVNSSSVAVVSETVIGVSPPPGAVNIAACR